MRESVVDNWCQSPPSARIRLEGKPVWRHARRWRFAVRHCVYIRVRSGFQAHAIPLMSRLPPPDYTNVLAFRRTCRLPPLGLGLGNGRRGSIKFHKPSGTSSVAKLAPPIFSVWCTQCDRATCLPPRKSGQDFLSCPHGQCLENTRVASPAITTGTLVPSGRVRDTKINRP